MDPRQPYNQLPAGQTSPRFSWQMPADDSQQRQQTHRPPNIVTGVQPPQQQQNGHAQQTTQNARSPRFSYISTPVEHQQATFQQREPLHRQPTEPTIPQSPDTVFEEQGRDIQASQLPSPQGQNGYPPEKDPNAFNTSPYHIPEPTAQHPALAPYINTPSSPPPHHYTYPNSPISPGPIPMKSASDSNPKSPTSPTSPNRPRELYIPHREHSNRGPDQPIFSPDAPVGPNGPPSAAHLPGQIAHPNMTSATGHKTSWKHSLFGCGSPGDCLTGLFCPCVLYGKTSYRLERKSSKEDATDMLAWDATNWRCGVMALSCGLWCLFPMIHRTRIRHSYGIEGGVGEDVAAGCCCCCCVTVQNEREVREREENRRRWAGPATEMQYTREAGMVYGHTL